MKKLLGVIGTLSLVSSISGSVVSCSKPINYLFNLKTEIGEIIDTFDKRDVEDYYFDTFFDEDTSIRVAINFKSIGLKDYGFQSGNIVYWLIHLVKGLNLKPAQEKYEKTEIKPNIWKDAGLWDSENNRPKD